MRVCGICCNIKGEAVENVKRGGIRPKQEVGRYVMKDGYDRWCKEAFIKARERRLFHFARYEELRIG